MSDTIRDTRSDHERNLPVAMSPAGNKPSLARYDLPAHFVSHLIATRDRLTARRLGDAASARASAAYLAGSRINVRRMPAGYNRKLDV